MTIETIALGVIAGFFIWRLYRAFDKTPPAPKIKLVSPQTGEVLEMQVISTQPPKEIDSWNEERFVKTAQAVFREILSAFSCGQIKRIKSLVSEDVYRAFEAEVAKRESQKQKMEFSLICFDSAKILSQTGEGDRVIIRFQTEQINLLKDEQGQVIEGDPMTVAQMEDIWTFQKSGKASWTLVATQSRMAPCAG